MPIFKRKCQKLRIFLHPAQVPATSQREIQGRQHSNTERTMLVRKQ